MRILHTRDVSNVDGNAIPGGDHYIPDLINGLELSLGSQQQLVLAFLNRANRQIEIFAPSEWW